MKYNLGIVGGLGPLASCYLYELITKKTKALTDQEHLNIVLLSHASIPDRTAFILGESDNNPFPYLLNDCKALESLGVKMISIPCNTSCYFHDRLQEEISVPINSLVSGTAKYIYEKEFKKVAIMATDGTIKSNLYQKELDKYGVSYVIANQKKVMEIIYDYVKKGLDVPKSLIDDVTSNLDVDAFILGCTELSVVKGKLNLDERFVDPLEIEVDNILSFFEKK